MTKQNSRADVPEAAGSAQPVSGGLAEQAARMAGREIDEAERELKSDLAQAKVMVTGLSAAALLALFGLNLVTFAVADALSLRMPRWAAKLGLGAGAISVGAALGLYGWRRRVRDPLWQTRAALRSRLMLVLGG
jgi:hypothetical protein